MESNLVREIARRIKILRQSKGIRQADLSDQIGLSHRHFQKLEAGEIDFRASTIDRLAESLGVSPSLLIGPEDPDQIAKRLSFALKIGRIGFWYVDRNSVVGFEAQALEEILGIELGEGGKARVNFASRLEAEDRCQFEDVLSRIERGEIDQFETELRFNSPTRGPIWVKVYWYVEAREKDGRPLVYYGFCQDITCFKTTQELEATLAKVIAAIDLLIRASRREITLSPKQKLETLLRTNQWLADAVRPLRKGK